MDWLTLLGESTSVQSFFFDLFLGSFDIPEWDFGDLTVVAKISGMTTTLQTSIFLISGFINVGAKILNKPVPNIVGGPMYFGGPFQIVYALMPKAKDYTESIKSLDAKISQWLGFISQVVIIVAAIFAAANRVQALDPFIHGDETLIGSGYTPKPNSEDQFGDVISPSNTTQVTLAVQNAALFARATYIVSVVAIIMTSLLNIIQWLADVWRVNKGELLVYFMFKLITRALMCQPCLGDKCLDGIGKGKKGGMGKKSGKVGNVGSRGLSRSIPSKLKKSPLKSSPLKESMTIPLSEKSDEKSESSTSLSSVTEKEKDDQSLLSPDQSSSKKLALMVENICGVKGNQGKPPNNKQQLRDADGLLRDNRELRIKLRQLDTENSHLRERVRTQSGLITKPVLILSILVSFGIGILFKKLLLGD
ncbi:13295_t:CDS:2 [Rhizophagus irregularis]|nr:13295_t:CDS:2 [Rhizophagus irregularis]